MKQNRVNSVKKLIVVVPFFLLFSLSLWAKVINKTVATVNGEVILLDEYNKKAEVFLTQYKKFLKGDDEDQKNKINEIKKEIINQMIDEKLMLQEAKKKNIKVSKRKIEDGIKTIKSKFSSDEEFKDELKKQNINYQEFEDKIKEQLIIMELIDMEVKSKVALPTDEEIKKFYAENKDKMIEPAGVRVRHILIRLDKDADKDAKLKGMKKIKDIQSEIKKGKDFSELASKYSEDTSSAERGGDLGFFIQGEMVPEFEKASFALNVGSISDVVKTEFGYHLIKCEEKRAEQKKTLEEVRNNLKNFIFQQNMEKEYSAWIKKIKDKANIKISDVE